MTGLSMLNFFSGPDEVPLLASLCEELGNFERFWIGEHHAPSQVSDALTIAMITAATTKSIRVGTGAVSLTFRNPYMIAESAFLAELLVPGRIDLGVTRAAGTSKELTQLLLDCVDVKTVEAEYENRVRLLRALLQREESKIPGYLEKKVNLGPPLFLMGLGAARGRLAGELGLGLCSSFHHGGTIHTVRETLEEYDAHFRPSALFPKPFKIVCISGQISDNPDEVRAAKQDEERMKLNYTGVFSREISVYSSSKDGAAEVKQYGDAVKADEMMFLPTGNPASCAKALSSGWKLLK